MTIEEQIEQTNKLFCLLSQTVEALRMEAAHISQEMETVACSLMELRSTWKKGDKVLINGRDEAELMFVGIMSVDSFLEGPLDRTNFWWFGSRKDLPGYDTIGLCPVWLDPSEGDKMTVEVINNAEN